MNLLRWTLAVVLVATFPAVAFPATAVQSQMMDPVVLLGRNCSGIIIKSERAGGTPETPGYGKVETTVLTAKHCVRGTDVVTIDTFDPETQMLVSTMQLYYDVEKAGPHDLALIKLRDTRNIYPTVKIATSLNVSLGDPVYVVGWPFALEKMLQQGTFQKITRTPQEYGHNGWKPSKKPDLFILATAPVAGGNSGGALFQSNGDDFEVIGVTSMSAYRAGLETMNWFVPLADIHKFLGTPKEEMEKSTAELAKELAERIKCEAEAESEEDKAKCSEPKE